MAQREICKWSIYEIQYRCTDGRRHSFFCILSHFLSRTEPDTTLGNKKYKNTIFNPLKSGQKIPAVPVGWIPWLTYGAVFPIFRYQNAASRVSSKSYDNGVINSYSFSFQFFHRTRDYARLK